MKKYGLLVFMITAYAQYKDLYVVVTSYNNAVPFKTNPHLTYCEKNLSSIACQQYPPEKVHIFYIDDHSNDRTPYLVKKMKSKIPFSFKFKRNKQRAGKMANLYSIISRIPAHAIVVEIDGDDWLSHSLVFQEINTLFADGMCWVAHGGYELYPHGGTMGQTQIADDVLDKRLFRKAQASVSQLRVFYAGLFHKIKKEDLLYNGMFVPTAADVAYMIPLYEMAGKHHIREFKNCVYIYNIENRINDFKICHDLQLEIAQYIYEKPLYPLVNNL